mgnify:CR=1 FL=1
MVSGASILRVGESVGSFYGYKRLGVYTIEDYEAGNCEKKQIGRAKRSSEREIIGKGVPDWTGSMINTLRYKNLGFHIGSTICRWCSDIATVLSLYV